MAILWSLLKKKMLFSYDFILQSAIGFGINDNQILIQHMQSKKILFGLDSEFQLEFCF